MDGIVCDRCDGGLLVEENVRYIMKLEIYAAYDPMEITEKDLERDFEKEFAETIQKLEGIPSQELRQQVYMREVYDLCAACQRAVARDPLQKRRPENS